MADLLTFEQHRTAHSANKTDKQARARYNTYLERKNATSKPDEAVISEVDRFDDEPEPFTEIRNENTEVSLPDLNAGIDKRDRKAVRQIGQDGHLVRIKPVYVNKTGRSLMGTSGDTIDQKLENA